jgi:branched-chain amino acid transport system permease protein
MVWVTALILFLGGTAGLYFIRHLAPVRAALGGAAMALAFVMPHLWFTKETDGYLPLFTIVLCAVYALFALGLNIVVGFAGLLDLGYVAFFLVGAYVGAWLMSDFAVNVRPSWRTVNIHFLDAASRKIPGIHLSFWIVVVIAGLIAALAGVIIGAPTLRLKSDYLALVTLGFGEILPEVFRNSDDVPPGHLNLTNGTKGIGPVDRVGMGFLDKIPGIPKTIVSSDYRTKYYVILAFCGLFVWVSVKLRDGRLGRAWMAIREDELAASLMGVPLMRTKLWSYAVGAVAGGVGGAFYATIVGTVNVDTFTFAFSIIVLCAVILGGMGNVWGVCLGGAVLSYLNYQGLEAVGNNLNQIAGTSFNIPQYTFGIFGVIIVVMMLVRPQGLIPTARRKIELEAGVEGGSLYDAEA